MTLRWRLNVFVLILIAVFLAVAGLTAQAVRQNAEQMHSYLRMREASQFTADLCTHLYQQLARQATATSPAEPPWPPSALEDVEIQVRQSLDPREKRLWRDVRRQLAGLSDETLRSPALLRTEITAIEQNLRELRNFYDSSEYTSAIRTAYGAYVAQVAIALACGLTVLLFLSHLVIVRRWMLRPIQVLKDAAQTIGQGHLDHRVPLHGSDELSQLARSIDAMAAGLATYQADLLRSRELSALGELCANVAHGLRNPLAAIRSTAQLAERRAVSDEEREVFRNLSTQADRMDQRITTLFQFSRPIDLQRQPTPFSLIADSARAQALPLLSSRGIAVEIEDESSGLSFDLDAGKLAQAVAELLTNAAHHSKTGSRVVIRGRRNEPSERSGLWIEVVDEGAGMSAATAGKAFDLFFTSRTDGTGMGLNLVRRIVERHEGEVQIASEPGRGTRVSIFLPGPATAMQVANARNGHSHTSAKSTRAHKLIDL